MHTDTYRQAYAYRHTFTHRHFHTQTYDIDMKKHALSQKHIYTIYRDTQMHVS